MHTGGSHQMQPWDLTEHAPAENDPAEAQQCLTLALQGGNVGLWDWNIERRTVYLSPEWKQQLGYQDYELENRLEEWEQRLHPDDRGPTLAILNAYLEGRRPDYKVEFRLRHKDGSYRWILSQASLRVGRDGKPLRLSGCHVDITERKRSEEGAEAARRHLDNVIERVSDGFVALDRDWRYTYVNKQAANLFGRRPEDLIGKNIWTEFPEGVGQPFHQAYEKAMAEQVFVQTESYYAPWKRWFENRIYPSPDGISIFFQEVTDRVQAERAARENAELLRGQNRALELIAQGAPLEQTLDLLLRSIEAQSPGMLCSVLLLDPDGIHVRHCAGPSLPESYTRAFDGESIGPRAGSCGTAAFRRETVVVEDIATDPLWDGYRDFALKYGLRACWSTPIFDAERRVLGTFALYFRSPGSPTKQHWQLIETATHTAAIAIVQHRETAALRASEKRLRLAVTGGNIGIWERDLVTDRLFPSDQLTVMFGLPAGGEGLTLEKFREAIYPDDRVRVDAAIELSIERRSSYDIEFRVVHADGSLHWIETKGRCEYDDDGKPVRMLGVALDITDRKRAEEKIHRREAQLAEAQRVAHVGSYEWDIPNNIVHRSEELCRIFGSPSEELPPNFEGYLERVHPEDRDTARKTIEDALRERKPFEFDERIVRPDGEIRVLHSLGKWILDEARNPVKLVGICQDITERKHAEDELRRSEERFQLVARATNDAIWDWDLVTKVLWWNQAVTTLFKYPPSEVSQDIDWWHQRLHPDDKDRAMNGLQATMDKGEQFWSDEYRFRRADGTYADIFDRGFVMYDSAGKPIRAIGAMADISERKRTMEILEKRVATRTAELETKNRELEHEISRRERVEELLRARNEELKAFAYTVSHDLKAPLRGIAGYAQELDRRHSTGFDERAQLCLNQILTATRNLDRLIEDLLHYSRLDAENPTSAEVNLANLVEAILRDRKPLIHERNAEVTVNFAAASIHTWERGLLQILTNLIDNALKYSRDSRPPRIHISSQELSHATRIMVSDNGIGFDMKYHDRIFGLFNRLVRQEEFEGTGAGLAIVKKVVDKMGGRIWAEAEPGSGAKFFVELPKDGATAVEA
jgi:PAS domain S-box-containing protein